MDLGHSEWPLGSHILPAVTENVPGPETVRSRTFQPRRAGGQQARKQISKSKRGEVLQGRDQATEGRGGVWVAASKDPALG